MFISKKCWNTDHHLFLVPKTLKKKCMQLIARKIENISGHWFDCTWAFDGGRHSSVRPACMCWLCDSRPPDPLQIGPAAPRAPLSRHHETKKEMHRRCIRSTLFAFGVVWAPIAANPHTNTHDILARTHYVCCTFWVLARESDRAAALCAPCSDADCVDWVCERERETRASNAARAAPLNNKLMRGAREKRCSSSALSNAASWSCCCCNLFDTRQVRPIQCAPRKQRTRRGALWSTTCGRSAKHTAVHTRTLFTCTTWINGLFWCNQKSYSS